jgi:hypothetical protein
MGGPAGRGWALPGRARSGHSGAENALDLSPGRGKGVKGTRLELFVIAPSLVVQARSTPRSRLERYRAMRPIVA